MPTHLEALKFFVDEETVSAGWGHVGPTPNAMVSCFDRLYDCWLTRLLVSCTDVNSWELGKKPSSTYASFKIPPSPCDVIFDAHLSTRNLVYLVHWSKLYIFDYSPTKYLVFLS
jgi:hypothetical protein